MTISIFGCELRNIYVRDTKMKIDPNILKGLIKSIKSNYSSEKLELDDDTVLYIYSIEDFTLSFTEERKFFGMTFEILGREFSLLSNGDLLVSIEDEDDEAEAYSIEDPSLVKYINDYFVWRTNIFNELHF